MEYEVLYTKQANEDLEEIYNYISHVLYNIIAAKKLIKEIFDSIDLLATFPKSHKMCEEPLFAKKDIRFLIVNIFMVFYSIKEAHKKVVIYRVIYCRRDISKIKL